jgi:hypothetical protein
MLCCSFCTLDGPWGVQYSCRGPHFFNHEPWGTLSVTSRQQPSIPFAAQAIPFDEFLASGKLPDSYLTSEYVAQQFVERLVHYILSVPAGSYTMAQLSHLLEQLDPRTQVFFFKRLKETSPDSLKDFAPLYYGFMNEFHSLLFT